MHLTNPRKQKIHVARNKVNKQQKGDKTKRKAKTRPAFFNCLLV